MRSPEFLDSWKKAMDSAIQFRHQMNQALGKMHHEFQGTSRQDIDQLMMALTHLERRVVDEVDRSTKRIDEIADRIGALEEKLSVLEAGEGSAPKSKSKKESKPKPSASIPSPDRIRAISPS